MVDIARPLYEDESLGLELKQTVLAFDATVVDLCLSLFPWAEFRRTKGGLKIHTLLDLQSSIPVFIDITAASIHEVNLLDQLFLEPGTILIMDRGYLDFERLYKLNTKSVYFIIRAKKNFKYRRVYSHKTDKSRGVQCDQTIKLTGYKSQKKYPQCLRIIKYYDQKRDKKLLFLSNNFKLPAKTIADLTSTAGR